MNMGLNDIGSETAKRGKVDGADEGIREKEIRKPDELKEDGGPKEIKEPDIEKTKNVSLESLIEENDEKVQQKREAYERDEYRPLTEEEKKDLKEKTGMTDANIEKCTIDKDGVIKLECTNKEYAGGKHPETKVPFVEKVVDINGVKIKVVAPEFPKVAETMLPDELRSASSSEQLKYLKDWLKEEIKSDPELRAQFTEEQIAMIEQGEKPKGFTWHHNEECGKMQLVKSDIHVGTGHTGGNSIWSGGN